MMILVAFRSRRPKGRGASIVPLVHPNDASRLTLDDHRSIPDIGIGQGWIVGNFGQCDIIRNDGADRDKLTQCIQ